MSVIQLSSDLKRIQSKTSLVQSIKRSLLEAFQESLPELRGNIQLITEILVCIESVRPSLLHEGEKDGLFFSAYEACFGTISDVEQQLLKNIVEHLRSSGQVYRRTRFGNFIRAVLRAFRA